LSTSEVIATPVIAMPLEKAVAISCIRTNEIASLRSQ
jgi:hypothetical protein